MNRSVAVYWLAFLVVACTAYGFITAWRYIYSDGEMGAVIQAVEPGAELLHESSEREKITSFTLTDSRGGEFSSDLLDGQVWIGSFFFTSCPGDCLKMNQILAGFQEQFADEDVRFVSISCDPANDTPSELAAYAEHFHADPDRWVFLTGDMETVKRIGLDIFEGISVESRTHSDRLILMDRHGKVRGRYHATEPAHVAMLAQVLRKILAESELQETVMRDADEALPAT